MRILVVEHEPEGHVLDYPNLLALDAAVAPMEWTEADRWLLVAAATFPTLYHRGPHSGAVADYLFRKFPQSLQNVRIEGSGKDADPLRTKDSDPPRTGGGGEDDDPLLESECKRATARIETLVTDMDNANLYEELEKFVKDVQRRLRDGKLSRHDDDPESDGSVHPERDRIGHLAPLSAQWPAFCAFFLGTPKEDRGPLKDKEENRSQDGEEERGSQDGEADDEHRSHLMDLYFPDEAVSNRLVDKPYFVDAAREFDPDEVDEKDIQLIHAPLFHRYRLENHYDGLAALHHQMSWLVLTGTELTSLQDSWQCDGEGENYPPSTGHHWEHDGEDAVCHDVFSRVPIYFSATACPAVGYVGVGLRQEGTAVEAAKAKRARPSEESRAKDPAIELAIRQEGVFARRHQTLDDKWTRLGPVEEWPELGILVLRPLS